MTRGLLAAIAVVVALFVAVVVAGCGSEGWHAAPSTTPAASSAAPAADTSCQTATDATIRASGVLNAGITARSLSRAATLWKLAAAKISGHANLVSELDLAALTADRMVLDLRLGQNADLARQ